MDFPFCAGIGDVPTMDQNIPGGDEQFFVVAMGVGNADNCIPAKPLGGISFNNL